MCVTKTLKLFPSVGIIIFGLISPLKGSDQNSFDESSKRVAKPASDDYLSHSPLSTKKTKKEKVARYRILVVEDSKTLRSILCGMINTSLTKHSTINFSLKEVATAEEALSSIQTKRPQIVFLDYSL